MSLNLFLQAGVAPSGTALPGNVAALLAMIAQYVDIAGGENFNGINFGSVTPSADNRDKPWWRTDANGQPLGMYSWNGSAWVTTAFIIPNGPSASRPLNPANYTEYFDTTINRLLIYERGQWRTADGCVGEVREVEGATIEAVIALNPGWIQHTASISRVIGGAGTAAGVGDHAPGSIAGEENTTLGINQIPAHTHTTQGNYGSGGEGGSDNPLYYDSAQGPVSLQTWPATGATGSGEAHNTLQPTYYLFRIVKQ